MASRKRMHCHDCTATPTRSRKRPKLGDITNSSQFPIRSEKEKGHTAYSYGDQLVPDSEPTLNQDIDSDMYCSENFEQFSFMCKQQFNCRERLGPCPGGFLGCLPPEVLHNILSMLGLKDILSLCVASHVLKSYVHGYVFTSAGLAHILPAAPLYSNDGSSKTEFIYLGKLIKGLTVLEPVKTRLKVASFFLDKLQPVHLAVCECWGSQTAYNYFGATFHAFVSGWGDREKMKAYELIKSHGKILERINTVLRSSPGSLPWHEKDIRVLHQELFLCPVSSSDEDYGLWLSLILKPWPLVFQAKLLYLLTAPSDASGMVYWTEACGCSHLQHTSCEKLDFSELARALRVMYHHKTWTENDIVTIFNEVTTSTPTGWCLENVAQLLFGCGTAIVKGVLGSKAINGRMEELGMIFYYMANCCINNNDSDDDIDEDIGWFLHILSYVTQLLPACENKDKFITDLIGKWQTYLLALFEDYDPITATDTELEAFLLELHSTIYSLSRLCRSLVQSKIQSLSN